MKKFLALAVLLTFCFLLTSCSSGAAGSNGATEGQRLLRGCWPRTPPREPRA